MGFLYPHLLFSALFDNYRDRFLDLAGGGKEVVLSFWQSVRGVGASENGVRTTIIELNRH